MCSGLSWKKGELINIKSCSIQTWKNLGLKTKKKRKSLKIRILLIIIIVISRSELSGIKPKMKNPAHSHDVISNTHVNNGNKDRILALIHKKGKGLDQTLNPKTDLDYTIAHIKEITNLETTTVQILIIIIKIMTNVAIIELTNLIGIGITNQDIPPDLLRIFRNVERRIFKPRSASWIP